MPFMSLDVTVAMKKNKLKDAAPVESSSKAKKSVASLWTSASRPKYSELILQAVITTNGQGKMNVSRPDIVKYVVANYNLDPTAARRHINVNLKKMVESGQLKPAAAAGRKGAGSFRLGQAAVKEKTTGKPRKATAGKKTTAAKAKGNKATKGTKTSKGAKPKSVAAGKSKKVSSAKPKKAPKAVKPKK